MRNLKLVVLILALAAMPARGEDRHSISIEEVDSLRLAITLNQIIGQLERRIIYAKDLLRQRQWAITKAYYEFQATRKALDLLRIEAENLRRLYHLDVALAKRGEISDAQRIRSHNAWLAKQIAVLYTENECRRFILEIARLGAFEIVMEQEESGDAKKTAH